MGDFVVARRLPWPGIAPSSRLEIATNPGLPNARLFVQASLARALVFYARSEPGWRQLAVETVRHVTGLRLDHVPAGWRDARWVRRFFKDTYQSLSYVEDWREAFARHPRLRVSPCNINNPVEIVRALRALKEALVKILPQRSAP